MPGRKMSNTRHERQVPIFSQLPRPIWGRPESWGEEGSVTAWHQHAWGQFSYAATGILQVQTRNVSYVSPPNYGIWIPQDIEHRVVSLGAAEMRSLYISTPLLSADEWQQPLVCEISPLCRELVIRFCQGDPYYAVDSKQARLAQVMLDELQDQPSVTMELPLPSDKRILKICQALQNDPANRRSIEQWGNDIGLTGRSISRLFVLQTGLTFQQWRQRVRLIHALSLLQQGCRVAEVADQCGYDALSAFSDAFKQQFRVTPGQFFNI
jgi:AraC-like DNA-binding protein